MTPPEYPTPTVKPENYITLKEAIGDLITDSKLKKKKVMLYLHPK